MRQFIIFGQKVVPEKKHNKIVANLNSVIKELEAKNAQLEADNKTQKEAYLHLAEELEDYKSKAVFRDEKGRFAKRTR